MLSILSAWTFSCIRSNHADDTKQGDRVGSLFEPHWTFASFNQHNSIVFKRSQHAKGIFLLFYTIHFEYQTNEFYAFVTDFYRYCNNNSYVPSKPNAVIIILSYSSHGICQKGIRKMGLHVVGWLWRNCHHCKEKVNKNATMYRIFGYLKLRIKAMHKKSSIE